MCFFVTVRQAMCGPYLPSMKREWSTVIVDCMCDYVGSQASFGGESGYSIDSQYHPELGSHVGYCCVLLIAKLANTQ
jgi:hypothetical protein